MKNIPFAVVFLFDPDRADYKGAKELEEELAQGRHTAAAPVRAVSGRIAKACARQHADALPPKEWFPADKADDPGGIEVTLDKVHRVITSTGFRDDRWGVMVVADISFEELQTTVGTPAAETEEEGARD